MPRYTASSNPDNQYSLDCGEGPMKKIVCLFVCGFVSGSKVKGQKNISITTSENLVIYG